MISRRLGFLMLSVLVGACSADSLPERGFATRFYLGAVAPSLDSPRGPGRAPLAGSSGEPIAPDSCEAFARARSEDVADQGFSAEVQQKVFEATQQDCQAWRQRSASLGSSTR
jgi:hypothetical protein